MDQNHDMVNCNIQSNKVASLLDSNLNCGDKDELSSELKHRDKAEIHNLDFLDSSLNDILEESITNTPTPTNNKKDI